MNPIGHSVIYREYFRAFTGALQRMLLIRFLNE